MIMKTTYKQILLAAALVGAVAFTTTIARAQDPLPSWNDGAAKSAIVNFVKMTTDSASPKFVPPAERIATFDQDGTLWVEHPVYSQVMYCLDQVPALVRGQAGIAKVAAVQHRAGIAPRRPRRDGETHNGGP